MSPIIRPCNIAALVALAVLTITDNVRELRRR